MVQISDCFEAVKVFRRWRNGLFAVTSICLLALQGVFWATYLSIVTGQGNQPDQATGQTIPWMAATLAWLRSANLAWLVDLCNAMTLFGSILYLFCTAATLGISIVGRLGGIKHISKAFFHSLVVAVLLVPWQDILGPMVAGAIFSLDEICKAMTTGPTSNYMHYLRFSVYPLALLTLLAIAQWHGRRWTKVVLQRLEIL